MKNQKNSRQLKSIVKRYLNGTATEEELLLLKQWDTFFEENSNDFSNLSMDERTEIKDEIKNRLDLEIHQEPKTRRMQWTKYAAAILLFATIGLSIYFFVNKNNNGSDYSSTYADDVLPGTNKATITLSDGTHYELSDNKDGVLVNEQGIQYEDGGIVAEKLLVTTASIATPNGGQYRITLPDGTKVWLNAASSLKYPTKFLGKERLVQLEGEAYFEVAKNTKQPFLVESSGQRITVLGTHFNVMAYPEEVVETTLAEGSIQLNATDNQKSVILSLNQQASLEGDGFKVRQVQSSDYIAWTENMFVFNELSLAEIFSQLERWYDVEINYPADIGKEKFYAEIPRNQKLSQVLKAIGQFNNLKYKIEGRRVVILK